MRRQTVNFKVRPDKPLRSNQRQVGLSILGDETTVMTMLNFLKTIEALSLESQGPQWVKVLVDSELDELEVTIQGEIETLVSETLPDALNQEHDMLLVDEAGVHPYPPPMQEGDGAGAGDNMTEES